MNEWLLLRFHGARDHIVPFCLRDAVVDDIESRKHDRDVLLVSAEPVTAFFYDLGGPLLPAMSHEKISFDGLVITVMSDDVDTMLAFLRSATSRTGSNGLFYCKLKGSSVFLSVTLEQRHRLSLLLEALEIKARERARQTLIEKETDHG